MFPQRVRSSTDKGVLPTEVGEKVLGVRKSLNHSLGSLLGYPSEETSGGKCQRQQPRAACGSEWLVWGQII